MSSCSCNNHKGLHIVKAGFLRKFKKGFLCKGFKVVYAELSKDGYLLWYRDQFSHKRDGYVDLKDVCDFLAVGPYTRSIPSRMMLPKCVPERNLVAVPAAASRHALVNWFLCANDLDLNEWMMTINCVLLPPKNTPQPILAPKSNEQQDTASSHDKGHPHKFQEFTYDFKKSRETMGDSSPYESIHSNSPYASIRTFPTPSTSLTSTMEDKRVAAKADVPLTTTHNGSRLPIPPPPVMPSKKTYVSDWGWLWGCGMGWGIEGWHVYEFVPSMGSEVDIEALKEVIEHSASGHLDHNYDHNHECHFSDDAFNDYDCSDFDAGLGDVGFDTSLDIGGIFDAGFSFGF